MERPWSWLVIRNANQFLRNFTYHIIILNLFKKYFCCFDIKQLTLIFRYIQIAANTHLSIMVVVTAVDKNSLYVRILGCGRKCNDTWGNMLNRACLHEMCMGRISTIATTLPFNNSPMGKGKHNNSIPLQLVCEQGKHNNSTP